MKRSFKVIMTVILLITTVAVLFGCDDNNGASAYEIAVKNGFVGTEAEWLESLKGTDGTNGLNGTDGADGKVVISAEDFYNTAVENGFNGTFLDFMKEYLKTDVVTDDTYAVSKAIRSAVIIRSNFSATVRQYNFNTGRWETIPKDYTAGGAGVIYKMDGNGNAYIITNFHVVYDADSEQKDHISENIEVYLYGGTYAEGKISATFVGGSAYQDIAVLRVTESEVLKNSDAVAVEVSDEVVSVGQTALAIGYPAGEGMSVTKGIVSVDSEQIEVAVDGTNYYPLRVMRVDTAINSGNSGGGLFDSEGRLIGIVNAKYNSTKIENIGYAIPKEVAIGAAENIIKNCVDASKRAVYKCLIGVTVTVNESKAVYDEATGKTVIKETIKVAAVSEGGAAEGLLQEGDILLSAEMNGKTVILDRTFVLSDFLFHAVSGDTVKIYFDRGGETMSTEITFIDEDVTEYFTAGSAK